MASTVADIHLIGTAAGRPAAAASNNGYYYTETDVNGGTTFRSNGSSWVQVAGPVTATGTIGGSSGSTDNAVIRADGTGGATVQSSLMTVDDSGTPNIPTGQTYNINGSPHTHGASSGTDFLVVQVFS